MAKENNLKWQKKRNARLRFYAKSVKVTRKELAKAGLEMSYNKARKFTSQIVYSRFKDIPPRRLRRPKSARLPKKPSRVD